MPSTESRERKAPELQPEAERAPLTPANLTPKRRVWPTIRRWAGRAGKTVLALLVFGVVVSVTSYSRTPAAAVPTLADSSVWINEVTQLFPVRMARVVTPRTVDDIVAAVKSSPGPISIGGGRYSMGGQTATPDGLQLDMREYHGVISLDTAARTVVVRSGTRWRELQEAIDKANLAVKIMQTYNTFTVGGALSVNAHGRYLGEGPLVRSVRQITLVLADGRVVTASPQVNPELFFGAVGGYGALGVIADVTLDLAANTHVRRDDEAMPLADYLAYFRKNVRDDTTVIFHNADIYPRDFQRVHAVNYRLTAEPVTVDERIQPREQNSAMKRFAYSMMSGWSNGPWIREHMIDPLMFRGNPVTWRNYEASYDVSELEPDSRVRSTYVLQEYFVPVDSLIPFMDRARAILREHDVKTVNISIRHALPDPGTFLAWAPVETFAFVLYYRQDTDPAAKRDVARWTRDLIDAAEASGGRYYLPYQPVATRAQFTRGYPRSAALFAAKRRVDPSGKFTNVLWDSYQPTATGSTAAIIAARMPSVIHAEARLSLDSLEGYARDESRELLTHPEWDLVYGSEAYATWLEQAKPPSGFPYIGSVGTFWRSYHDTWAAASERYDIATGTHVMLNVIGISTAIEYGLKGVYEGTIGRLFELNMPAGGTAEDRYAAKVARDYAKLISTKGWYEFGFGRALRGLWTEVPMTGPGFLRKWERRFALTAEFVVKAVYAKLIGMGTSAGYAPDALTRQMVVAGWSDSLSEGAAADTSPAHLRAVRVLDRGYTLLAVGRYDPFRDELLRLAERADRLRIAEINGSELITMTGVAPAGWKAPARSAAVTAYRVPAAENSIRVLLQVQARDLLDVIRVAARPGGLRIDHIYDY
jgi:FAD/FMN-containing dehydrogenase